jgi:hypothetical protein
MQLPPFAPHPSHDHHHPPTRPPVPRQRYILALRIKELTEVLDRLGLKKGGRKADLQTRIMSVFSADGAARCGRN